MTDLIVTQTGNKLVVDSRLIAEALGIEHESLLRLIKGETEALSSLGVFGFEIGKLESGATGRPQTFCYLNESQANYLMTLVRNTPQKKAAALQLIKAFEAAKDLLTSQPKTGAELLAEWCANRFPGEWEKRFPDTYYEHLQRFTGIKGRSHPRFGQLTNELVYEYLPVGLLALLKQNQLEDPKARLHQFLSDNGGLPVFRQHMDKLLILMGASASLTELRRNLATEKYRHYQLSFAALSLPGS